MLIGSAEATAKIALRRFANRIVSFEADALKKTFKGDRPSDSFLRQGEHRAGRGDAAQ
jgi:hypothetical protein